MAGIRDDLEKLKSYAAKFKGRSGYKLLPSLTDPSKKRWQRVEEAKPVEVPPLRRKSSKRMSAQEAREYFARNAEKGARELREEHPEFLEEMKRVFTEAKEEESEPGA